LNGSNFVQLCGPSKVKKYGEYGFFLPLNETTWTCNHSHKIQWVESNYFILYYSHCKIVKFCCQVGFLFYFSSSICVLGVSWGFKLHWLILVS